MSAAEPTLTANECHEELVGGPCRANAAVDWYPPGEAYIGIPLCHEHAGTEWGTGADGNEGKGRLVWRDAP